MPVTYLCIEYIAQIDVKLDIKDGRDISTVMEYFDYVIALKNSLQLPFFPDFGICWHIENVGLAWHDSNLHQSHLTLRGRTQIDTFTVESYGLTAAHYFF